MTDLAGAMAPELDALIAHLNTEPSRTWTLIITLFVDCLSPRGGSVWLGSLTEILTALAIGEGVVRTAMSRLTADGWLIREKLGRNTYYRVSETVADPFAEASEQIYRRRPPTWQGGFDMIVVGREEARALAAPLTAAGWGQLDETIFVSPTGSRPWPVADVVPARMTGDLADLRRLAARAWPLQATAERYDRFIATFSPLRQALGDDRRLAPLEALAARILLIHAWRRIVLHDPLLPPDVLAADWPGTPARALCAGLYRRLLEASEAWLDTHALGVDGRPLPARPDLVRARFAD